MLGSAFEGAPTSDLPFRHDRKLAAQRSGEDGDRVPRVGGHKHPQACRCERGWQLSDLVIGGRSKVTACSAQAVYPAGRAHSSSAQLALLHLWNAAPAELARLSSATLAFTLPDLGSW